MDANNIFRPLVAAGALALCGIALAQSAKPTVRHHRVAEDQSEAISPEVSAAEAALENKDYSKAEALLQQATQSAPSDYRAWFDLAQLYTLTGRKPEGVSAYQKSIAAKPDLFESNLNLGLLLASLGQNSDAVIYLKKATQLKPQNQANSAGRVVDAWLALGKVQEATAPQEALEAYKQAAAMDLHNEEAHLGAARNLEKANRADDAEKEYTQALAIKPRSADALAGLSNLYIVENKLREAERVLQQLVALIPTDVDAHLQLGKILASESQYDEAAAQLEAAHKLAPNDLRITRELAGLSALRRDYPAAESEYSQLVKANPNDAELHFAYGTVLMDEHKFAQSQPELVAALKLDPSLADAYGNLATVAAENQDYPLVIQTLDQRSSLQPENPGTYFLRATSYDHLKDFKQAARNYKLFLQAANGKFPNQEWQARHRLVAITHRN